MNKLLLASTALVASTTFAMADVDLSGSAEMGVFGGSVDSPAGDSDIEPQFHTDIDVTFSMSGETDGGLTFGASIDLDEQIGDNNADDGLGESAATRDDSDDGGATMFVAGSLGQLSMGDTDGAFDFAMTEAIIGSSLRDDHEHAGYNGNSGLDEFYDGQVARYDYSFGDFAVAASAEIDDGGSDDPVLGIGATYSGEFGGVGFGVGVGYQTVDTAGGDAEVYGISLDVTTDGGIQGVINYSELDAGGDEIEHFGIAVGYEFSGLLVAANYGQFDDGTSDVEGYGLIANYDLGGGAELQGGYASSDLGDDTDVDTYSFGIAMTF